ncbi:hypothetical protein BT96DRAFT_932244 [Gymnopus androsaceus JB14]|uniref:Uncharacterized protein n=1 Tax=Gymnopus androsaceus JB14 TaxID=1447944 RepID=A0A6A4IEB6_9AGAR|nr:hypothetical protein BT96DRAFT_932244 [Gymnopus androsaceus JB14]
MASDDLESLWNDACAQFEKANGCSLSDILPGSATTSNDIEKIFENAENQFATFREKGSKLRSILKPFAETIHSLADVLGHGLKLIYPPAEAITAAVIFLLEGSQRLSKDYDALQDLLTDLRFILGRVRIYATLDLPEQVESVKELVVKCLVQVLENLRLVSHVVKDGRRLAFLKTLIHKDSKIQEAFKKLDQLAKHEGHTVDLAILSILTKLLKTVNDSVEKNKNHSQISQDTLEIISSIADEQRKSYKDPEISNSSQNILKELQELALPILQDIQGTQEIQKLRPPFNYQVEHNECLKDTRPDIFRDINDWVDDRTGPNVFWLEGPPGTGKSTISTSL